MIREAWTSCQTLSLSAPMTRATGHNKSATPLRTAGASSVCDGGGGWLDYRRAVRTKRTNIVYCREEAFVDVRSSPYLRTLNRRFGVGEGGLICTGGGSRLVNECLSAGDLIRAA